MFRSLTLLMFLILAAAADIASAKISNRLIAAGLVSGLLFRIFEEGFAGILAYLFNISIPVILLYLLFQMRALGAGDIKLFSAAGAFLTAGQLLTLIAAAFFAGAAQGICALAYRHIVKKEPYGKSTKIHFSIAILIAYLFHIWRWRLG